MRVQPASKRRVMMILSLLAAAAAASAVFYLALVGPLAPFTAKLQRLGSGWIVQGNNVTIPYVNFSLTYSSPAALAPASLVITVVCSPACYSPFAQNATMMVPSLDLSYSANSYPHWLVISSGSMWTGFTGTARNPDGKVVGGGPVALENAATSIESGAVLTITLPVPGVYPEPAQSIRLTYAGHPGSVEAPLG